MVINKQEIIDECFSVEQDKSHSRQKHHYHHNTFPDFKKKSLKIFPDKNVSLPKQCPCPTLQKDRAYVSHTTPMYDHANLTLYVYTILGLRGSYLSGVSENNVSDVSLCLLSFSLNTWVILCKKS